MADVAVVRSRVRIHRRRRLAQSGIYFALIALFIVFALLNRYFLTIENFANIGRQTTILAIGSFAMTLVILCGEIDLSVGAVASLVGVVVAGLLRAHLAFPLAILLGVALGTLIGLINGVVIVRGQIASFLVTLGMLNIAEGASLAITQGTTLVFQNDTYRNLFALGSLFGVPAPIWFALILFLPLHFLLTQTRFGAHIYAVGGNEQSARMAGIATRRIKIIVFTLSGLLMGLAALVLTARVGNAEPQGAIGLEFDAIAAVVIGGTSFSGGRGSLIRTIIGALLIGLLNNGLTLIGVTYYAQLIVKGLIIVLAVLIDRWTR